MKRLVAGVVALLVEGVLCGVLVLLLVIGLSASSGPLLAQPARACDLGDPPLARGETDVVADDRTFARQGHYYPFSIFGLGAANPDVSQPPYDICLRYEFVNRGSDEIQELRWRDVGLLLLSSVPAGARHRIPVRKWSNTKNTAIDETDIYAFENARATSRTVFAVQQQIDRPTTAQSSGRTGSPFSLIESFPAVGSKLRAAGVSTEPVPAIYLPAEKTVYPTLRMGLESLLVSISIRSSATVFPQDSVASIYGEIRVVSKMEGPVAVYAPGLQALQLTGVAPDDSLGQRTARFLQVLPDSNKPLGLVNSTYAASLEVRVQAGSPAPALFVAEHPVTVTIGEWSACLIAQAYSPVPVSLSDPHCRTR